MRFVGLLALVACSEQTSAGLSFLDGPLATATTVSTPTTTPTFTSVPPPSLPVVTVSVVDHGARADDDGDDQDAIQAAIDAAPAGATVVFPAGTYRHRGVLTVRTPGVKLSGYGATLVSTDPKNQAIILRADNTEISGFTIEGSATNRLHGEEQMGISLHYSTGSTVRDNIVRGTASAGIFIRGATAYAVRNNTVENTLSDGIHSTAGASGGIVEGNTARNTGDDCFAVVSYVPDRQIANNIVIRNNSCVGGKARGVSVVGGEDILVENNTITATAAAGVYLASEGNYNTFAAKRVQVIGNRLVGVNTNTAIRHGGIFVWARAGAATTSDGVSHTLQNEDILIRSNTISDTVGGLAHIVAQGSFSRRVNLLANVTNGKRAATNLELDKGQYNQVGAINNGGAIADHIGNAAFLP